MTTTALRFDRYGPPAVLSVVERDIPVPGPGEVLIEVRASAINPSDVKNVAGAFHTVPPRTPGRDYAGIVVAGEGGAGQGWAGQGWAGQGWAGREVWGSGPGFGVGRDGAHARHVVAAADGVTDKPAGLSMEQAASVGVPFLTAWSALVTQGDIQPGETVLIVGAAGAVGRAAAQIARWKGAMVLPAVRGRATPPETRTGTSPRTSIDSPADAIDTGLPDLPRAVRERTGGMGADLVLDTVGGALFEPSLLSLREGGRHIAIASNGARRVSFDLIDFYHNKTRLMGVDSLKLTGPEIAAVMNLLRPGFEAGALQPFEVRTWPLSRAVQAYEAAALGGPVKQILLPGD